MLRASAVCEAAGFPTSSLTCEGFIKQAAVTSVGIGHSIDEQGLRRGGQFLRDVLSGTTP